MSDNAYGSPAGGGTEGGTSPTSDQEVSTPQGGQPEGQEPQGNEQVITPEYLKEMETRIKEEMRREAQSMTDKMGSRLDKEIQSALSSAKENIDILQEATGKKLTASEAQAIREKYINNAYDRMNQPDQPSSSHSSEPQPAPEPKQDMGNQPDPAWVAAGQRIQKIMADTGVYIPPDEANRLILGENGENEVDPFEYVQAFESLAKQRQSNSSQPRGPNPNLPSLATGGKPTASQMALRQNYEKELAQIRSGNHPSIRRGDIPAIQRLEISYREKGLEI